MTPLNVVEVKQCIAAGRTDKLLARLQGRLARYEMQLLMLNSYDVGIFGDKLGLTVNTPCVECGPTGYEFKPFRERAKELTKGTGRVMKDFGFKVAGKTRVIHILHRCDNRKCVNAEHIFYGTSSDNMRDMLLKGRHTRNEVGDVATRIAMLEAEIPRLWLAVEVLRGVRPLSSLE